MFLFFLGIHVLVLIRIFNCLAKAILLSTHYISKNIFVHGTK